MKNQQQLLNVIQKFINPIEWLSLRGVIANWEENTLFLKFYFYKKLTEIEEEETSVLASEIFAQFPEGYLHEEYIILPLDEPLPASNYWAYTKNT